MASAGADTLEMHPDATAGVCNSFLKHNLSRKENRLFYRQTVFFISSFFSCSECICNFLGTERSQCMEREDCVCQRATGQCQCLANVVGLSCDHCAPNHWNLASGNGCEACNCDPNNSVTSSCNEVS